MSKWLTVIPIENKSANVVAKAIFEKFILIYGPMKEIKTDMGYVKECKLKIKIIYEETKQLIEKVNHANKKTYDKNINPIRLEIGDLVKILKEPYDKFKYIYDGPYEVKGLTGKNIEIRLENGTSYTIHKNRIIKY